MIFLLFLQLSLGTAQASTPPTSQSSTQWARSQEAVCTLERAHPMQGDQVEKQVFQKTLSAQGTTTVEGRGKKPSPTAPNEVLFDFTEKFSASFSPKTRELSIHLQVFYNDTLHGEKVARSVLIPGRPLSIQYVSDHEGVVTVTCESRSARPQKVAAIPRGTEKEMVCDYQEDTGRSVQTTQKSTLLNAAGDAQLGLFNPISQGEENAFGSSELRYKMKERELLIADSFIDSHFYFTVRGPLTDGRPISLGSKKKGAFEGFRCYLK